MTAAPVAPDAATRRRMQSVRTHATGPEIRMRSALAAAGVLGIPNGRLPMPRRRADLVLPDLRIAVFVDGCYWHGCPEHFSVPTRNGSWWSAKVAATAARDRDTDDRLAALGWRPVRVWEHDPADLAVRLVFLSD